MLPAGDRLNYMAVTVERQTKPNVQIPLSNKSLPVATLILRQTKRQAAAIHLKKQGIDSISKKKDK
ncbi:hypothetical protein DSLASN_28090 [Desulfoluna limicola]|uniref:Uncharacterized protein n=1 Tax=Desulfoluna limicola TaxID=2810562 RepID=A0ABN6F790_9BACT|nr:hypothetical protein DSLASN_28090 [Desulfoluna limicola]